MKEAALTQVCNHKAHGLRWVFCSGTKPWSANSFLCFKYELQVRLGVQSASIIMKTYCLLRTLVYSEWPRNYGTSKTSSSRGPSFGCSVFSTFADVGGDA